MMASNAGKSENLASSRDRRSNAGNRMSRLLEEEDEDDFYKTTYGGFDEASACINNFCISRTYFPDKVI